MNAQGLSAAADIFALGAVLYELATHTLPYNFTELLTPSSPLSVLFGVSPASASSECAPLDLSLLSSYSEAFRTFLASLLALVCVFSVIL
jgi:serine/threonine protein kinase